LSQKIPFYASLGNHDDPTQRFYKLFNMNGERFYTFKKGDARFFALDSNYMDQPQLKWLEEQLSSSNERWKIAFFHHPLYSSGARHGSEVDLRLRLEPLFVKYGVDIVFAGHEHFYERIVPQKGIYYFTQGGSAKLREGNIRRGPLTAAGYDTDNVFMVAELGKESMFFQVVSRAGRRVDSGSLPLMPEPEPAERSQ
jgi:3',5'-cyclic AMP phosphodiesterase CpdA